MQIALVPNRVAARIFGEGDPALHLNYFTSSLLVLMATPGLGFLERLPHVCLMQALFSVPCPGCGILHAMHSLYRLDMHSAMVSNPAGLFVAVGVMTQLLIRPVAILKPNSGASVNAISQILNGVVISALMSVWIARLVMITR